jgi:hypothetical protein
MEGDAARSNETLVHEGWSNAESTEIKALNALRTTESSPPPYMLRFDVLNVAVAPEENDSSSSSSERRRRRNNNNNNWFQIRFTASAAQKKKKKKPPTTNFFLHKSASLRKRSGSPDPAAATIVSQRLQKSSKKPSNFLYLTFNDTFAVDDAPPSEDAMMVIGNVTTRSVQFHPVEMKRCLSVSNDDHCFWNSVEEGENVSNDEES